MPYIRRLTFKSLLFTLLFALFFINASSYAVDSDKPVWDDQLIVNTLDNGLRYIVHNDKNKGTPFNLRLIVNIGSIDDELRGMAHIIEHMVFRTNNKYPGSIHQFMDSIGWKAGLQINALTRQTETQYMIRTRPDDALDLQQSIELMANIAFDASILDEDWQVERQVILEEMRVGEGVAGRINDAKKRVIRNHSRYIDRPTIGYREDINKATVNDIKAFYKKYYVPTNMTLVISGSVDPEILKQSIERTFGAIPATSTPDRHYVEIPLKQQLHIGKVQDSEGISSVVTMGFRNALKPHNNMDGLYQRLQNYFLRKLASTQVRNQRLLYKDSDINTVSLTFKETSNERLIVAMAARTDHHDQGLDAVISEITRLKQNGLHADEFLKLKEKAKKAIERNRVLVEQRDFQQWEDKITTAVIQDGVLEDYEIRAKRTLAWIDQMTLDELNLRLNELLSGEDQFIYYQVPGGKEQALPSREHVRQLEKSIASKRLNLAEPVQDKHTAKNTSNDPVEIHWPELKQTPKSVSTQGWEPNVKRWTLPNGDSVVWLNQPTNNQKLYLKIISDAGYLNHYTPMWLSQVAAQTWEQMDLSFVSAEALSLWQSSQGIQWQWVQKPHKLELGAIAHPGQLGNLMRLYSARVRFRELNQSSFVDLKSSLEQQTIEKLSVAAKARISLFEGEDTQSTPTKSTLDTLGYEQFKSVVSRFSQQPVTLYIVGETSEQTITKSVLPYLSSLPRTEKLPLKKNKPRAGKHRKNIAIHSDNKATVTIKSTSPMEWKPETSFLVSTLNPIIQKALKNELRHRLGGVYRFQFEVHLNQNNQAVSTLSFVTNPARVDELIKATEDVYSSLDILIANEDLSKIQKDIDFAEQLRLQNPNTWMRRLELSFERYQSPEYLQAMDSLSNKVTAKSLTKLARQIFPSNNQAILVGLPIRK